MTRFLVSGASGLLGLNFCIQTAEEHQVIGIVHQHNLSGAPFTVIQTDLSNPKAMDRLIDQNKPEVIVHCAAMANVDACESQPVEANQLNSELPAELAALTQKKGIKLVHISTDAIFDGKTGNYQESDTPIAMGVYARSKLAAEKMVQSENPSALIARVNFYGNSLSGNRSLSEFFLNALTSKSTVLGFRDVYFCPLLVNDLVDILLEMVQVDLKGIYHTVSSECLNKYQFGVAVANQFALDSSHIKPVSVSESGLTVPRSLNLCLRTDKLSGALGRVLPDQQQGLKRLRSLFDNGYHLKIRAMSGR